jgi:hypothetical protein
MSELVVMLTGAAVTGSRGSSSGGIAPTVEESLERLVAARQATAVGSVGATSTRAFGYSDGAADDGNKIGRVPYLRVESRCLGAGKHNCGSSRSIDGVSTGGPGVLLAAQPGWYTQAAASAGSRLWLKACAGCTFTFKLFIVAVGVLMMSWLISLCWFGGGSRQRGGKGGEPRGTRPAVSRAADDRVKHAAALDLGSGTTHGLPH